VIFTGARKEGSVRLEIANLKGGTGKTTTAVHVAAGLAAAGGRTLLVDADPQQSALAWSEAARGLGCPVVGLPVRDLHRRLPELEEGYRYVVVDTPPSDLAITRSALLAVEEVIVPIGPTPLDLDRLGATLDLLAEVEPLNAFRWALLLTRLRRGTRSSRETRAALEDLEMPVMRAEVPLREAIGLSFGVARPSDDYERVVDELLAARVAR
jgi:chromosome partitioning protein